MSFSSTLPSHPNFLFLLSLRLFSAILNESCWLRMVMICHPSPSIPGLSKILPAWQSQSEPISGWVGGRWEVGGLQGLAGVISQQRWSDGESWECPYRVLMTAASCNTPSLPL